MQNIFIRTKQEKQQQQKKKKKKKKRKSDGQTGRHYLIVSKDKKKWKLSDEAKRTHTHIHPHTPNQPTIQKKVKVFHSILKVLKLKKEMKIYFI